MSRDLTTDHLARTQASGQPLAMRVGSLVRLLGAMALGALLLTLVYQVPVVHTVDLGGYDSAYAQGFYDPERSDSPDARPYLAGSDGSARWTPDTAYLLFPQAGLPAQVTLRLRGWRASGPPPDVRVLLNGARELGHFRATGGWEEHSFAIDAGLLKPNDLFIEIRAETAQLQPDDPRRVGVLLDRATYRAGPAPITPYPAQLLYGALAAGLLYISLVGDGETKSAFPRLPISLSPGLLVWFATILAMSIGFLALYRAQPPYPYPVRRLLPMIDAALGALLALRYGPALARRAPALLDALALGGLGVWTGALLLVARAHMTLSVPGVEKDFRVFATRSDSLAGVFQADGFYNLGYPLLLWLARPFAQDNPFLVARLIAAFSAAILLGATWWLARRWLGRAPALLALLALALSPLVVEYALYLGTDMPFAALSVLALALLLVPTKDERRRTKDEANRSLVVGRWSVVGRRSSVVSRQWAVIGAGLAAGAAFLVRHPGVLLLPLGWLALALSVRRPDLISQDAAPQRAGRMLQALWGVLRATRRPLLLFTLAFLIAILPQLAVNVAQTGRPLYSQQAKNIWLAVFGDGDWGRWGEAANEITLGQVLLQDPGRFMANWWANVRGYVGAGGEDTSEFGHAIQLRLLGFPANWLAIIGLIGWLVLGFRRIGQGDRQAGRHGALERFSWSPCLLVLLAWVVLYVLAISVGFALPRFFLPLAPVYAIAMAWLIAGALPQRADSAPLARDELPDSSHNTVQIRRVESLPRRHEGTKMLKSSRTFVSSRLRGWYLKGIDSGQPDRARSREGALQRAHIVVGLVLLVCLWGSFATATGYVLGNQPPDEVAAVRLVQTSLAPAERLIVRVPSGVSLGKYSAIAHRALPAPVTDDPAALRALGADYLLWSSAVGPAPAVGPIIGSAGPYTLYRISP